MEKWQDKGAWAGVVTCGAVTRKMRVRLVRCVCTDSQPQFRIAGEKKVFLWYREGTFHSGVLSPAFMLKRRVRVLFFPPVSQMPLTQNKQHAKTVYFGGDMIWTPSQLKDYKEDNGTMMHSKAGERSLACGVSGEKKADRHIFITFIKAHGTLLSPPPPAHPPNN